jgi:predicted DNA-binding protein (MmcQ/YjbR family)
MDIIQLRDFCLSFPQTTEDIKWDNDLCVSILGKMFCIAYLGTPFWFSIKVEQEELSDLLHHTGVKLAPYLGRYNWISIENENSLSNAEIKRLIQNSYLLVLKGISKKKREEVGLN